MLNTANVATEIANNGGFTYSLDRGRFLVVGEDAGWAIAVPGTEILVGDLTQHTLADAVTAALALASAAGFDGDDVAIGGWHSPERGYLVEVTTVLRVDRPTAETIGVLRDQDAVFDIATGTEVDTRALALV